jgi:hypothetical protein
VNLKDRFIIKINLLDDKQVKSQCKASRRVLSKNGIDFCTLFVCCQNTLNYVACPGPLPRHATRRAARHRLLRLARLVVDYFTSRRLVIDYLAYDARPGISTRHVAHRRLLHLARLVVDYFTSRRLVVDYFAYVARPGISARRAARRQLLHLTRLVVDYFAYASRGLVIDYYTHVVRPGASARRAARR